ncbi:hypothetical protein [Methanonatronarchaeum sp. AMET-Sl]|uniref:hypothetical protein n=1 Tax=Methanonatronarchaeum sp. AMET-Sl TaxID=3037654 RepID=UPI00244E0D2E|nr:hypothetical protein [Methanonatronarchaeum sp. AMET-Sl]WGI17731.1 hypothetical protein QEN48_01630 [Methanonatronarchaeum sp. AMET-Sl]
MLIPVCLDDPKTGLSSVLGLEERRELTRWMLRRVVEVAGSFGSVFVVSPNRIDVDGASHIYSDRGLNPDLEMGIDRVGLPVLILPCDIPLIEKSDLGCLVGCGEDVVISPGDRGGTNGLLLRKRIKLQYNGESYRKHTENALEKGFSVKSVCLNNVFRDIDSPCDLSYLLKFVIENNLELNELSEEIVGKIDLRCRP